MCRLFIYGKWYHIFSWTVILEMFLYQLTFKNCCILFWSLVYYNVLPSQGIFWLFLTCYFSYEKTFQDVVNTWSWCIFIWLYLQGKLLTVELLSQLWPNYKNLVLGFSPWARSAGWSHWGKPENNFSLGFTKSMKRASEGLFSFFQATLIC